MRSYNKQVLNHLLSTLEKLLKCFPILQPRVETINVFSFFFWLLVSNDCVLTYCVCIKTEREEKKQTNKN